MDILLSTAYFGPIQYFSKFVQYDNVWIEQHEHFPKQTFRNRCNIYSANGVQVLSVPVTKGDLIKIYTKDIRLDYAQNWPKIHFKAIESAYRNSPYFEFYIDDLIRFFEKKYSFLLDFNCEITQVICELIGIKRTMALTVGFEKEPPLDDFRDKIHPKERMSFNDSSFRAPVYHQVFETKYGFIPNLSILDLLFSTGPDSLKHLQNSVLV
jgi:hypothetical protein